MLASVPELDVKLRFSTEMDAAQANKNIVRRDIFIRYIDAIKRCQNERFSFLGHNYLIRRH